MKLIELIKAFIVIIGFAIVGWLSFMHPNWILLFGAGTGITTLLLLLIVVTPAGNIRLGKDTPRITTHMWFLKLCRSQLAMFIITIGSFVAFFSKGPSFAQNQFSIELFTVTIQDYALQWGIIPWSLCGLWGLVVAYVTYVKKGVPYVYQIAQNLTFRFLEPSLKTYVEGVSSAATMLSLSLCASSIILLITYAIENLFSLNHFQVPYVTFFVMTFLASFFTFKSNRKWLLKKPKSHSTYTKIYCLIIILSTICLIIGAFANRWFIIHQAELYQKTVCQQCGNYFSNVSLETRFAAFYWGWWLIWTPLCGSYIAKISKGRTLRELILGLFFIPVIIGLAYYLVDATFWIKLIAFASNIPLNLGLILLAGVIWFMLNQMIKGHTRSDLLTSGLMPLPENMPTSRLWLNEGSKSVALSKFCQRLLMLVISVLFLHMTAGWYGIQLQVTAMAMMVIYTIYWALLALLARFFKDNIWLNAQAVPPYSSK